MEDLLIYKNYAIGQAPAKIENFKYAESISDILLKKENDIPLSTSIIVILSKYLPLNVKARSITSKEAVELIVEHIKTECGNLELQEIEWIFKNGIMGRFGEIYNDISIDTICGKNGWLETYYNQFRKLRPEPKNEFNAVFSGKEQSATDFYESNPDYEQRKKISEILIKSRSNMLNMEDIKYFYKAKGFTLDDLKEDLAIVSKQYFDSNLVGYVSETKYIMEWAK